MSQFNLPINQLLEKTNRSGPIGGSSQDPDSTGKKAGRIMNGWMDADLQRRLSKHARKGGKTVCYSLLSFFAKILC